MTPIEGTAALIPEFARPTVQPGPRPVRLHDLYTDEFGAALYDDLVQANTEEIFEILTAVRRHPGDILELAAGSGRITVPLLAIGRTVTAVDSSPEMLALLEQRLAGGKKLRGTHRPVCADMVTYEDPGHRHDIAVISATSISLLDDVNRRTMFANLAQQLPSGALLVLSTVHSAPERELDPTVTVTDVVGASGRRIRVVESWPPGALERHVLLLDSDQLECSSGGLDVALSAVRVVPPETVIAELVAAGFEIRRSRVVSADAVRHRHVLIEATLA